MMVSMPAPPSSPPIGAFAAGPKARKKKATPSHAHRRWITTIHRREAKTWLGSKLRRAPDVRRSSAAVALGLPKTLPAKSWFLESKQEADNPGDNEVENRADHHAAHSAEQHEDIGLTKQHPDHQSADEGTKDVGD